jgi:RHS repeat-associated protein
MAYDTLGRLVSNTEPNSGTWTYAYNDAGEVVGTSDARGCGMNIYRDTLGRVTAEDYSPCTSSQPPYTAANPATGSGAEAFFVYDAYGRIAKNYDRAQFSTYLYDGRGRLEEIDRRVAPPGNIPTFSSGASGSDTSTVSISGVATDGAGNPLPGLTVTLSGSTAPATMQTGANGQYSFAGLTDGRNYSVNASTSISGCSLTPTTVANFNPLSTSATVDFQGQGGACGTPTSTPIVQFGNLSISGVVAASDGTGIPGIRITLSGNLQGTGQAVTHTDNSGFYAFDGLGTGSFSLNVGAAPSGCTVSPVLTTQLNFNNIKSSIVENFTATSGCEPGGGAVPGVPSLGAALDNNYAPHVFVKTFGYSEANRETQESTGADLSGLLVNGASTVGLSYLQQGSLNAVTSSYGTLVSNQLVDARGNPTQVTFGDAAKTVTALGFDNNESLTSFSIARPAGTLHNGAWVNYAAGTAPGPQPESGTSNTLQATLTKVGTIMRDGVGNPTSLVDAADPNPWPSGAAPTLSTVFAYWSDYRLREASERYSGQSAPNDAVESPYTPEELSSGLYVLRTAPMDPSLPPPTTRVTDQTYSYDGRGNVTASTDDKNDFYDRSLGTAAYSSADQMSGAVSSIAPQTNQIAVQYDAGGNIVEISNASTGDAYKYDWDEVGRLMTATRSNPAQGTPGITEQFAYDAGFGRVVTARELAGGPTDYTVQVFGSLLLQQASFPGAPGDYERDLKTERLYLTGAGQIFGHVLYDEQNVLPTAASGNGQLHVFMPLGDRLGSTAFVIDHDTGEVVERITYQPYGAVDSDYRPNRWGNFREDVRYTGHWDNAEVGLINFGARYYAPQLQRWLSPDPVTIHRHSGDPNPYAYAGGSPAVFVDPLGLQACVSWGPNVTACEIGDDEAQSIAQQDEGQAQAAAAEAAAEGEAAAAAAAEAEQAGLSAALSGAYAAANDNAMAVAGAARFGGPIAGAGGAIAAGGAIVLAPFAAWSAYSNLDAAFGPYAGGAFNGTPADEGSSEGGVPVRAAAAGGAGGGDEPPDNSTHLAIGFARVVEQQAASVGATHLMDDPNWRQTFASALGDPSSRFTVFLDGMEGDGAYRQLITSMTRWATGAGGSTDWEISQLYQSGRLGSVNLMEGGSPVTPNPFGP